MPGTVFNIVHQPSPALREAEGSIVAVTTAATARFPVRDALSSAPKAALEAMVRALAVEEGRYGVRANCVGPRMLQDGMAERLIESGELDDRALEITRGRRSRSAGSASPTTSPRRSASSPPTAPGSSAGRSWTWTGAGGPDGFHGTL